MVTELICGNKILDLSKPQIMGVLNVTPDSFSDGGLFVSVENACAQSRKMTDEGAAIIDVGGESTRPGARAVSAQEELDRVIPVIEAIHRETDVVISIDTSKPEVMREAVNAGAGFINDVRALREAGAVDVARECGVPICLMHMQGEPRSMQENPQYDNVVEEVKYFLQERIRCCVNKGIAKEKLVIDPGFGFGKAVAHNMSLVKHLNDFSSLGVPVLMGVSRKSTIGMILDKTVDQRLYGSIALAALCCMSGARILRVHDVAATADALAVCQAVATAD